MTVQLAAAARTPPREAPIRRRVPGFGAVKGGRRIATTYLNDDVIEELRARALKDGVSLAEQLRRVVEWGLASLEEVERG